MVSSVVTVHCILFLLFPLRCIIFVSTSVMMIYLPSTVSASPLNERECYGVDFLNAFCSLSTSWLHFFSVDFLMALFLYFFFFYTFFFVDFFMVFSFLSLKKNDNKFFIDFLMILCLLLISFWIYASIEGFFFMAVFLLSTSWWHFVNCRLLNCTLFSVDFLM